MKDLTEQQATAYPLVPYRHVMGGSQRLRVSKLLAEHWDARPPVRYWYPLREEPVPEDVLVLQDAFVYLELGLPALQQIIVAHGVRAL